SGIGIPVADLPHIFERFYRVDRERSRQAGGFGLGLAIVHQIIELHGGQIEVSSQPQQGSQFEIWLSRTADSRH
ncbi:MAG: ATP-binding protein, partial [Cyanobacteria bacterium P01_H01_bin.21]